MGQEGLPADFGAAPVVGLAAQVAGAARKTGPGAHHQAGIEAVVERLEQRQLGLPRGSILPQGSDGVSQDRFEVLARDDQPEQPVAKLAAEEL